MTALWHGNVLAQEEQKPAETQEQPAEKPELWQAKVAIIDKLTAQTSRQVLDIPSVTAYGKLEINARKCWVQPDAVTPEHGLLAEVYLNHKEKPARIFYGWLLKNNTELSHVANAKYDIQLLECSIKPSTD
jgi:hypothetical protein